MFYFSYLSVDVDLDEMLSDVRGVVYLYSLRSRAIVTYFMYGVHNHRFTLTMKISSFYISTVKMSVIFEKITPFCIMYEVIEIFKNLINMSINLCHQKPSHC